MKTKEIPIEIFSYYLDYFHDGGIENIICFNNEIIFEMESAAIYLSENKDSLPLSQCNTIYGRLHAKEIISIKKNEHLMDFLKMEDDCVNLISFELERNRIQFVGMWVKYGKKIPYDEEMFVCEVIAKEIYWEITANMTEDSSFWGNFLGLKDEE